MKVLQYRRRHVVVTKTGQIIFVGVINMCLTVYHIFLNPPKGLTGWCQHTKIQLSGQLFAFLLFTSNVYEEMQPRLDALHFLHCLISPNPWM